MSSSNLLHLLKKCTTPTDLSVASKGIALYQRKGADFNSQFCSYFINLCVQADKPRVAADLIVKPTHRLGAWVSKKSNLSLLKSLAKADDVESMISVAKSTINKGLFVQTADSLEVLMSAVGKSGSTEHYASALSIAEKSLKSAEVEQLKAQHPAPSVGEAKASE